MCITDVSGHHSMATRGENCTQREIHDELVNIISLRFSAEQIHKSRKLATARRRV